jgi:hypothetical protein
LFELYLLASGFGFWLLASDSLGQLYSSAMGFRNAPMASTLISTLSPA